MEYFQSPAELAEAAEFDVYARYAKDITSVQAKEALANLLAKPQVFLQLNFLFCFAEINIVFFAPRRVLC